MFWKVKAQICLSIYNTREIIGNSNLRLINWCHTTKVRSAGSLLALMTVLASLLGFTAPGLEYMSTGSIEKSIELQSWRANVCVKPKFQVRQGASRTFVWFVDFRKKSGLPETFRQRVSKHPCAAWFLPFHSEKFWNIFLYKFERI